MVVDTEIHVYLTVQVNQEIDHAISNIPGHFTWIYNNGLINQNIKTVDVHRVYNVGTKAVFITLEISNNVKAATNKSVMNFF